MNNVMKLPEKCDFLVIGGGIIGICVALEIRKRHPSAEIILLEKESTLGAHASTRNSGVLHAGFYYTEDSLKARFCREGNAYWTHFCESHNLPILKCGKLVVARDGSELDSLNLLKKRGDANGVVVDLVSQRTAKSIDPLVKTYEKALFSPDTSSVDPKRIINKLADLMEQQQIRFYTGCRSEAANDCRVKVNDQTVGFGHLINCAGLYADRIAEHLGVKDDYRILPFKGLYMKSKKDLNKYRTHIYPVPDLNNPFLGVHITLTVDGYTKLGPTAFPAFWREQYRGSQNFNLGEFLSITARHLKLMVTGDPSLRNLARKEMGKRFFKDMFADAALLASEMSPADYPEWSNPGIRAQLVNITTGKLEMDFVIRKSQNSTHVLNAVSPGFTCAAPFAGHVCDEAGI